MKPKSTKLDVVQTPFCGDLRSKKYYLRDEILLNADDYYDASGHTFCYHTQMPLGPDGEVAAPENCGPDRPCYRSAFEEPEAWTPPPTTLEEETNPEV